ncbi:MAG: phosphoenolpyruvate carboxykinase (ATP), partial [Blastomonas sp.]|nr:phosphoenolpyruvate carboxykinase (ATP) [Blastomonas sp.]
MAIKSKVSLADQGITATDNQHWNLGTEALVEEALRNGEGSLAKGGALVVATGKHT